MFNDDKPRGFTDYDIKYTCGSHLVQCVNMSDTPILPNAAIQSQH